MMKQVWKFLTALALSLYMAASMAAVDVNKANAAELDAVKGIGPGTSARIIEARKAGEFKNWQDFIDRVKGVGNKNAKRFADNGLTVNGVGAEGVPEKAAAPAKNKADKKADKKAEKAAQAAATAPAAEAVTEAASDKAAAKAGAKVSDKAADKATDKAAEKEAAKAAKVDEKAKAKAEKDAAKAAKAEAKDAAKAAAQH